MRLLLLLLILLSTSLHVQAQEDSTQTLEWDNILMPYAHVYDYFGVYCGASYNNHTGLVSMFDKTVSCCNANGGTSIEPVLGASAIIEITPAIFISPRLSFEKRGAELFADKTINEPTLGENNQLIMLEKRRSLDAALWSANLDALAGIWILRKQHLYALGGFSLSTPLQDQFDLYEETLNPQGLLYINNGETKVQAGSQDFSSLNTFVVGARAGVGILIPAFGVFLNPELVYHAPISAWSIEFPTWKSSHIQLHIGVMLQKERE